MKIRFYIAPFEFVTTETGDCWQIIFHNILDSAQGECYSIFDNPSRRIGLCHVVALEATHTTLMADSRIVPLSPLADDATDLRSKLDTVLNDIPNISVIKTKLENHGINTEWITGTNTVKDAMRYLMRLFYMSQKFEGMMDNDLLGFIQNNLTTTVANVPLAVRNKVKTWMQNRGLAIGWITNTTTVREILHFIITNLGIGKIKMVQEEF